jgi:hypothetical protein
MPAIHRARSRGELALVGRLPPSPAMVCTIPFPSVKPGVRVWGVSWGRWAGRCRIAVEEHVRPTGGPRGISAIKPGANLVRAGGGDVLGSMGGPLSKSLCMPTGGRRGSTIQQLE